MSALADDRVDPQPSAQRINCPRCRAEVLEAPLVGGSLTILLERDEVTPLHRCPTCLSVKQRDYDVTCWRCGDTTWIGEPMIGLGAAVDPDGQARPVNLHRTEPREGEAVHRAHTC